MNKYKVTKAVGIISMLLALYNAVVDGIPLVDITILLLFALLLFSIVREFELSKLSFAS